MYYINFMPKMLKNVISGTVGNLTDGYDDSFAYLYHSGK